MKGCPTQAKRQAQAIATFSHVDVDQFHLGLRAPPFDIGRIDHRAGRLDANVGEQLHETLYRALHK